MLTNVYINNYLKQTQTSKKKSHSTCKYHILDIRLFLLTDTANSIHKPVKLCDQ